MNNELLTLIRKLKEAKSPEELAILKDLADSCLRREKREALLTLLTIYEEFGEEDLLASLQNLTAYLQKHGAALNGFKS